jgi:4-hydroxyphenylpyruvate dioxygenase
MFGVGAPRRDTEPAVRTEEREQAQRNHEPRTVEPVGLRGIDHIEFWVGNARQAAAFFIHGFGFTPVGYAGPDTGICDRVSYVLVQGDVRFVVSGALRADSEIAEHVRVHGDGVRLIAFRVDDTERAFSTVVDRGARPFAAPSTEHDARGAVTRASIAVYGDTLHTFVDRTGYDGIFLPGYRLAELASSGGPIGLERVDHVVANVPVGALDRWVDYYERVFGFEQLMHFGAEEIHTQYSALASTVMWDRDRVVLPINEPAAGRRRSQIDEYLEYYGSPGVQHIALRTNDIVACVRGLRENGVRLLDVPPEYHEEARRRLAGVDVPWDDVEKLQILVDRDEQGHLLQIFTENIADRPTVFFEVIQREGAVGFGEGNFRALFESMERAQARRGNL